MEVQSKVNKTLTWCYSSQISQTILPKMEEQYIAKGKFISLRENTQVTRQQRMGVPFLSRAEVAPLTLTWREWKGTELLLDLQCTQVRLFL